MKIPKIYVGVGVAVAAWPLGQVHADDQTTPLTEVIVTGTREKGVKAADSDAPIQVVSGAALAKVGEPDLAQALGQNLPSFTVQTLGGDTGNFTLSAALRGVSPNDTLVLVNGKRRHTTANLQASPGDGLYQGSAAVDLSLIPASAIDHIEVLQDGAAAQYGTDAVAGVINIILKQGPGGSFTNSIGRYYAGDGTSGDSQVNYGFNLSDRGYLNITAEARIHGRSQIGGTDYRVQNPDGSLKSGLSALDAAGVPGAPGYPDVNRSNGDAQYDLYNLMYNAQYRLDADVQFYSFGSYSYRNASSYENYRLPSAVTRDVNGATVALYPNGFSPREAFYENDFSATVGFRGDLSKWTWDLSSTYGLDSPRVWTRNSANASLYANTGSTPTSFYDGSFESTQWTSNLDVSREVSMGFASPLNIAFGTEFRHETYTIDHGDPDSIYEEGGQGFPGFQPTDAGTHDRNNVAGYLDLAAEVVHDLHVDLAGRLEHYSDFGTTSVYKLTGRYDFTPAFALRGTVSSGFRAPTLAEEYYSATTLTPSYAIVQLPVNSAAAREAGFDALKPEKSTSFSVGAVIHPGNNLMLTIDAYQTTIRNRILATGYLLGQVGPFVVSQAVLDAITAHGNTVGPGMGFVATTLFTNAADTRTPGVDATLSYDSDFGSLGQAHWSLGANVNHTTVLRQYGLPAAVTNAAFGQTTLLSPAVLATLEDSTPRWRLTPAVNFVHGRWDINLRENIYGHAYSLASTDGTGINGTWLKMPVSAVTDLDISYKVTPSTVVSIGANNLFNLKPPVAPNVADGAGGYEPITGQYTYNSPLLISPYGINGGYYYAKLIVKF